MTAKDAYHYRVFFTGADSCAVAPLHSIVFGGMLKGIRRLAESLSQTKAPQDSDSSRGNVVSSGYGRARLWLGISAVGTIVTLSTLGLAFGVPGLVQRLVDSNASSEISALAAFFLVYVVIQLPFDVLGGYLLPRRFGRSHPPLGAYLIGLTRGIAVHSALLILAGVAVLFAGRWGGVLGTVGAGLLMSLLLLHGRLWLAGLEASFESTLEREASGRGDPVPITLTRTSDEGFTGGIVGVFRPRGYVLPARWREVLGPEAFEAAVNRRSLAIRTGSWWRGRAVALLFTLAGLAASAWLVGPTRLGTPGGTIAFSLWFSLWSFFGLLTLPSLSRRGVIEIDERAQAEGLSPGVMRDTTRLLDEMQDGEPTRPALIERFFHPIPSVQTRLDGPRSQGGIGYWDAARTSVYLSLSGLGLLGRAVHCNCGRPALWVFLPTD